MTIAPNYGKKLQILPIYFGEIEKITKFNKGSMSTLRVYSDGFGAQNH